MSDPLPSRAVLWLRSLVFWLYFMLSTMILAIPAVIVSFFSYALCNRIVAWWVRGNLSVLASVCKLHYRVRGFDELPDEPLIIYAKHQSTWETLYLKMAIPGSIFVAKRELVWIPFFGWALSRLQFILIDRSSGRKAVRQMVDQYNDRKTRGHSLVVFPEGTRKEVGAEPDYKIGGSIVAEETATRVAPVAHNAGEFWPRHSFIKWPGEIEVIFGPVISVAGRSADEIRKDAQEWIEGEMTRIVQPGRFPYRKSAG